MEEKNIDFGEKILLRPYKMSPIVLSALHQCIHFIVTKIFKKRKCSFFYIVQIKQEEKS